jgi:single-strand DNA-binding protein
VSIATNDVYYKENGQSRTNRVARVTTWGKTADIIEKFVTKGREIELKQNYHTELTRIKRRKGY